ncbi:MAG: 16S rRNA (guanine(966)-N(2))-methyltransferase RsmD [Verrucomicrobiota bacterium]
MRIIGGSAAGRLLKVPEGLGVRPTPDKVKLAVFNSLGAFLDGARVLDLFAGSGALGLECLSRGAREMVSIEKSEKHARFFRQNLATSGLPAAAVSLRVQDVFQVFPPLAQMGRQFDLIIADPPYGEKNVGRRSTSLAQRLLDDPVLPGLLAPGGLCVVGHTKRDTLEIPSAWKERKELRHGDTVMRFLERSKGPLPQEAKPEETRE